MNILRLPLIAAVTLLALGACGPKQHLTEQQVKSTVGLSMGEINAKLGRASSITNAGDSIWWEYIDILRPNGNDDGSCHIVFRHEVAVEVRC